MKILNYVKYVVANLRYKAKMKQIFTQFYRFPWYWLFVKNPKSVRNILLIYLSSIESVSYTHLSIGKGKDNLWGPVNRAKKVTIEYTTPKGGSKTLKSDGYFSHVIQHEIDHLNGVLFVSYITNPLNIWRLEDLNSYIKFNDSYPEIQ